jgi:broad specificity phosphatase PhoE
MPSSPLFFLASIISSSKWQGAKALKASCRSPDEVTERVDRLIKDIRDRWQSPVIGKPKGETPHGDVLVVAHGHILRAFAMRWAGKTLQDGPAFLLEAGGIGTLR